MCYNDKELIHPNERSDCVCSHSSRPRTLTFGLFKVN